MTGDFLETTLNSPTGAALHVCSRLPEQRVRAVIQINHGMAEHAVRYGRFARKLSGAGFAVVAHDHRGHGKTTAPDAHRGSFGGVNGFDLVIEDVLAVNEHIRARDPDTPVVCFGHSMGSIIALNFVLRHPEKVDGLVCWNAGVETGAQVRVLEFVLRMERLLKGRDGVSKLIRKLTFETWNAAFKPNRTDFDWLSRDAAEVDKYVADPDCGFDVSLGLWLDLLKGIYYGGNDRNLAGLARDLPVHVQGGGVDPCTGEGRDMRHLAARLQRAGLSDVTCLTLPETRHESLNEINRAQTTTDFLVWLDARFS